MVSVAGTFPPTFQQAAARLFSTPWSCRPSLLPAHAAVLHWGVKRPGRGGEWLAPPDNIKPENTTMPGGNSAETPFSACTGGRSLKAVSSGQARCSIPLQAHTGACGPPFLPA